MPVKGELRGWRICASGTYRRIVFAGIFRWLWRKCAKRHNSPCPIWGNDALGYVVLIGFFRCRCPIWGDLKIKAGFEYDEIVNAAPGAQL